MDTKGWPLCKVAYKKVKIDNDEVETTITNFPIVGIGASAGGLAAFEALFLAMPIDSDIGMAFIIVQHLAPDHESILSTLISKYTHMKVYEVEDSMLVQPNCVYVIPPNWDMSLFNGTLHLFKPAAPRGLRLSIDFFFRSLAQDLQERSIVIILSGTGSDGTQGLKDVKGVGGMVIVQDPKDCEFDGMPRSAVETGLVDYILPANKIASQLMLLSSSNLSSLSMKIDEKALKKIFLLIRTQTGHDFSGYKHSTIFRRIERRMMINQIKTLEEYIKYLKQTPIEVETLFSNFLIGVTSFFRDPEAFEYLKNEVIPKLFSNHSSDAPIRLWVSACSSGEEVYSIAILLQEYMDEMQEAHPVQIFATDIDLHAITQARAGEYPATIAMDISPERLERFFTLQRDGNGYKISKNIRNMIIFSEHNVIKDPPFSKLDFISCRNLLIYMSVELQQKVIAIFHYGLVEKGFLFLGTSETLGKFDAFFTLMNPKIKVYEKKFQEFPLENPSLGRVLASNIPSVVIAPRETQQNDVDIKQLPLQKLTEQAILQHIAPAAALINESGDILYLHGRMGKYLEIPSGITGTVNILKMACEGLHYGLSQALEAAKHTDETLHYPRIKVKTYDYFTTVDLSIRALQTSFMAMSELALYVVIIKESAFIDETVSKIATKDTRNVDVRITELKQELKLREKSLRDINEKLERTNGELTSYNEEMQSMNEEFQSTNEELETSKEELHSVNEELSTVNLELQNRNIELSKSNNDMNNLLAGTGIGTIFVDYKLCILRFTPAATKVINLIPSDIGRPISHIVSNLVDYTRFVDDIQAVFDDLSPIEVEVSTTDGTWYLMHIQPYRTLENVIEGAVISFLNISEIVHMRQELKKANELTRLAVVVRDASDAITVQDLDGHILAWNPAAVNMYGWSEEEALAMNAQDRIPESLQEESLKKIKKLCHSKILEPYATQRLTKDGDIVDIWMISTALVDASAKMYAIATTERMAGLNDDISMEE